MKLAFFFSIVAVVSCVPLALAAVQTKDIEYKQGDTTLKGTLAWDDAKADAKSPGILVIPEWWGMTDYPKNRAKQLAELGYVAFAADMYGNGQSTDDPGQAGKWAGAVKGDRNLMRARAQAGLDVLKGQSNVDGSKLAAIGYCFGGTCSLELAMSGADLTGIVSFHGGLDFPNLADAKNIKAKVLICNGAADSFIKPDQIGALTGALSTDNVIWSFINYPNAVHAFTNPDADRHGIKGIAYNAVADRQSWQDMKEFFARIFTPAER
jgi:dienelactone hydrolase